MIVNVGFVNVGTDDKGMVAFCESPCQLTAQAVCFFRGDLAGTKRLAEMIGDHIVLAAHSASLLDILPLGEQKLRICDSAVALPASDELAVIRLLRIFGIVQYVADGLPDRAALAGVQRHDACGRHLCFSSFPKKSGPHNDANRVS